MRWRSGLNEWLIAIQSLHWPNDGVGGRGQGCGRTTKKFVVSSGEWKVGAKNENQSISDINGSGESASTGRNDCAAIAYLIEYALDCNLPPFLLRFIDD